MRQRMIWGAAALSTALSMLCLGAAVACACVGPWIGCAAGAIAAASLMRGARGGGRIRARLGADGGVRLAAADLGGAEAVFWPIAVTTSLICLGRADRAGDRRSVWRDQMAPDGFRRIAAYGLWHRSAASYPSDSPELIARNAVTCTRTAPRPRWPRAE
jgi:hypothetical protein